MMAALSTLIQEMNILESMINVDDLQDVAFLLHADDVTGSTNKHFYDSDGTEPSEIEEGDYSCAYNISPSISQEESPSRRTVRFSSVKIREYAVVVGCHPCTQHFPPMSLDWQHTEERHVDLDIYEQQRCVGGKLPRLNTEERMERIAEVSGTAALLQFQEQQQIETADNYFFGDDFDDSEDDFGFFM
jgi:hypothetical protein